MNAAAPLTAAAGLAGPARFEGSYLGDASRIADTTRMECKICWHVYDPAEGCETWQVPAGTPFAALPPDWRCPVCDGDREQFMTLDVGLPAADGNGDGGAAPGAAPSPAPAGSGPVALVARLEAAFREVLVAQMRGVPIVNEALAVKAVGFRAWDGHWLGALVTPWFLNLVLLPGADDDWSDLTGGAKELIAFPSGVYEFVHARRPEVGGYKACSLFSPMFEFTTMLQATETAAAALVSLFDPAIREEGARTGDIRRLQGERSQEEHPPEPAAPDSAGPTPPADGQGGAGRPSRRALLLGPRGGE